RREEFRNAVAALPAHRDIFLKLLNRWLSHPGVSPEGNYGHYKLWAGVCHAAPQARQMALAIAKNPQASAVYRTWAFMALAKTGEEQDIPTLEAMFIETGLSDAGNQYRDLALAVAIHLQ